MKLYKKITVNPRDSVSKLYTDLKNSMTKDMDPDTKKSYLKRISTFRNLQKGLYAYRSQYISRNPDCIKEDDLYIVLKIYNVMIVKYPLRKSIF